MICSDIVSIKYVKYLICATGTVRFFVSEVRSFNTWKIVSYLLNILGDDDIVITTIK